jgi:Flp pilus assembly protein TadD
LRASPTFSYVNLFLALARGQAGDHDGAIAAIQRLDPEGTRPDAEAVRGWALARAGRDAEARNVLITLEAMSSQRPVSAFHTAFVHMALGEHERALDLLELAAEERTWQMRLLKVEHTFDPLRRHPRFQAVLARVGEQHTPPK